MAEASQSASCEIAERVRANVVPCLIGAGLLLYFGFERLSEPTGTGLFERANWWFFHALRIGGVCMAAIAVWSMTGHRTALLADAVVTCPLGAVFVLTGPAMWIGGGEPLNPALVTIFGAMFISEGLRSVRAFLVLSALRRDVRLESDSSSEGSARSLGMPLVGKPPVAPGARLEVDSRSTVSERRNGAPLVDKPPVAPAGTSLVDKPPVALNTADSLCAPPVESLAPSGYLAAFAKKPTGESSTDTSAVSRGL